MKELFIFIALLAYIATAAQQKKSAETTSSKIKEVVFSRKSFHKKSDRFVYEVAKSPIAKGSSLLDLLKGTPLISTTDDKTLNVAGKSDAIIFLNGRKLMMSSDALNAFLKNTPAENIKKIEVITTPGSEYEVEASQAIINIVLKKKRNNGWNGNLRMENTQRYYNIPSATASFNFRKDKLTLNASINTNDYRQRHHYILRNGNSKSSNQSAGIDDLHHRNWGGYLNMDYALTDKSNLALGYNIYYRQKPLGKIDLFNHIQYLKDGAWADNYNRTKSNESGQSLDQSINLNYELKTDSLDSKLSLNASYLNYHKTNYSTNTTFDALVDGSIKMRTSEESSILSRITQSTPQIINNLSGKIDYVKKFKNNYSIAIGGLYSYTKTDNNTHSITETWDTSTQSFIIAQHPNHFIYTESIYALYATLNKKIGEKLSAKAGLRYEVTNTNGTASNSENPDLKHIKRNYGNLLPYVSLNYAINKNHNLSYTFSSRMRRPGFWEINPTRTYTTQYNYIQNNPFVEASSSYNQELTYMFRQSYFLIVAYHIMNNPINQIPLQREITIEKPITDANGNIIIDPTTGLPKTYNTTINELRYIRTNFGRKEQLSLTLGMQKAFFNRRWSTNLNIGLRYNSVNGSLDTDPITGDKFPVYINHNSSTSIMLQTNNNIQLDKNKTWYADINFWYVSKQQIELGELSPMTNLDVSLKKIMGSWTFAIKVKDLLNTNKIEIHQPKGNINFNDVIQNQYKRALELSITYNFGNKKIKKIRDIEAANESIRSRTN